MTVTRRATAQPPVVQVPATTPVWVDRPDTVVAAGGATTLASDTFTRTNAASIGSADVGGAYTVLGGGTWATDGSAAFLNSATDNTVAVLDVGQADVTVTLTNKNAGAAAACGIAFRVIDASNFWMFLADASRPGYVAQRIVAGNPQVVDFIAGPSPVDGDVLKVVCSGTTLTFFVNGAQITQLTGQTFGQTATKHGLAEGTHNVGVKLDDLLITTP